LLRRNQGGETTAVIAVVDESGVNGASVGDSGAWQVEPAMHIDLACQQIRKPLIGSGEAVPSLR
jgi:PPM family protein phosphatase